MREKLFMAALVAMLISVGFALALPSGPTTDITTIKSERWDTWGPKTLDAIAGNVTEFNTDGSSITRAWQGYFGNISGMIVLGDANNNTLYDWTVTNPQGEIYAVRQATVPEWTAVRCADDAELGAENTALGIDASIDEDAVNRTFVVGGAPDQVARFGAGELTHPLFYVANQSIAQNSCPVAVLYNSTGEPSPYFKEVLLSDGGSVPIIYTGIIAHTLNPFDESDGFDGRTHDFQMIVGENGRGTDTAVSTYWFYLEIE